jgi:hypothetical protein
MTSTMGGLVYERDGSIANEFLPADGEAFVNVNNAVHTLGNVQTGGGSTFTADLFTCASYAKITGVIVSVVDLSGGTVISVGTLSLGKTSSSYIDVIPATALTGLTSIGKSVMIPFTLGNYLVDGDVLKAKLSTAFTLTGGNITIEITPIGTGY